MLLPGLTLLVNLLFAQTREEMFLKKFDDTLAKDPKNSGLLFMRAMLSAEKSGCKNALPYFTAALQYLPESKKAEKAKDFFDSEKSLDSAAIMHNRAYCYKEAGFIDSAIADYRYLQSLKPTDFFYSIAIAHVYIETKDFKKAQAEINKLKRNKANNERGLVYQAILYLKSGKYDEALKAVNIVLKKYPESIEGLLTKARALVSLKREKESCPVIDEALRKINLAYFGNERGYQMDFEKDLKELKSLYCQ